MADNKEYLTQKEENGNINISEEVIASIAAVAATEVEGVASLGNGSVDIAEFLGKKSISKGVKLQIDEENIAVDLYVNVKYGSVVPTVAKYVQEGVASAIESMAGLTVTAVNVHVSGVQFEKAAKKTEGAEEK